ncbi:MAG: hypothetical protein FWG74_01965 [Planctomycetes bacterium]|nr:hypothetical protein [Planctomycetota bacterium]
MEPVKLPLWQFGKPCAHDAAPRVYGELACAHEFGATHLKWLRRVAKDVSWRPGGDAPYKPVMGCIPLDNADWLLLRFLDAGLDDHKRPHTLRIEAALCRGLPWTAVVDLLDPSAWPEMVKDGEPYVLVTPCEQGTTVPVLPPPVRPILLEGGDCLENNLFRDSPPAKKRTDIISDPFPTASPETVFPPSFGSSIPDRLVKAGADESTPSITYGNYMSALKLPLIIVTLYAIIVTTLLLVIWMRHDQARTDMEARHLTTLQEKDGKINELEQQQKRDNQARTDMEARHLTTLQEKDDKINELEQQQIRALPQKLKEQYNQMQEALGAMQSLLNQTGQHMGKMVKELESAAASQSSQPAEVNESGQRPW